LNNEVLFYNLGTSITMRHEAKQWRKARLAEQRAEILAGAMEALDHWRAAPWLALVFVVMVGGAFASRWINKGVLF
jgi:hypothetical protein